MTLLILLCFMACLLTMDYLLFRAYPNNPLYCGRLQSLMPALSAQNVLNVEKTTSGEHFGLPPWPRTLP
jgi:hypothetical protein